MTAMRKGLTFDCKRCGWHVTYCGCHTKKQHGGLCCECIKNNDLFERLQALKVPIKTIKCWLADGVTRPTLLHMTEGLERIAGQFKKVQA
jgi:hypothetical protein